MLLKRRLTIALSFRIIGGMDTKKRVEWLRNQLVKKQAQLEELVRQGVPFTDPRVLALSQSLDRLILRLQAHAQPPITGEGGDG